MRQMPVRAGLDGVDVELGRRNSTALDLFKTQRSAGSEGVQRGDQALPVGAGSRQRAHQHVSADSGKSVEIADFVGHDLPLSYVPARYTVSFILDANH